MTPTIHVMTIPGTGREEIIEELGKSSTGKICVHEDPERQGILTNHYRSVQCALKDEEPWSIFASDDIRAYPEWEVELKSVIHFAPAPFISLTHFAKYGQKLKQRGVPFGVGDHCIWGPAFMVNRSVLSAYADLVGDVVAMDAEGYRNWDDGLPTVFNLLYGTKSAFTSRALFEHMNVDSVMGHNLGHWRHAESTIEQPGPWWGNGKVGAPGLSVQSLHRDLARAVVKWRREQDQ